MIHRSVAYSVSLEEPFPEHTQCRELAFDQGQQLQLPRTGACEQKPFEIELTDSQLQFGLELVENVRELEWIPTSSCTLER